MRLIENNLTISFRASPAKKRAPASFFSFKDRHPERARTLSCESNGTLTLLSLRLSETNSLVPKMLLVTKEREADERNRAESTPRAGSTNLVTREQTWEQETLSAPPIALPNPVLPLTYGKNGNA